MSVTFDYFGQPEIPYIVLANPNKEQLFSLGLAFNTKITKRFNALSEFKFDFPESIDGGNTILEAYSFLRNKRLVLLENVGCFQIDDVIENINGSIPIKTVTCKSMENELVNKRVVGFEGTMKLYDPITPSGSILYDLLHSSTSWTVGDVDGDLTTKLRTFKIDDSNIYEVLMNNVSKAFECVFVFDGDAKTVSAYSVSNATTDTDIFLSFDNVLVNAEFSEKSDEICTALNVSGGNGLTISGVNPFGTKIYDFSYYKNTLWMSQSLIDAITAWESVVEGLRSNYSDLLLDLKTQNGELIALQGQLSILEAQYKALEIVQKARIEAGQSYADITAQMNAKQIQINNQETLIENKENQIDNTEEDIQGIVTDVSFAANFTPSQLIELNGFIYENTYNNPNIIVTDIMTLVEIQEQQQKLYDQAVSVLDKVSQPRYELVMESINYLSLPEFSVFSNQTTMGCVVTAEIQSGVAIQTVLLQMEYSLDDPIDFRMTFSNRLRLDGDGYSYSDLLGEVVRTGSSVTFNNSLWSDWGNNYKDPVSEFITGALNAANNEIINSTNQEITINETGLRGKTYNPDTGTYDSRQVWLTSSILAFTDNNWQTAKTALGRVTLPGGGTAYGLVADVIVGRLLAGNNLTITNANNSFILNGSGATLTNATFNITNTNSRIFLDPANGLKIQQNIGGTWTDRFSVTSGGNVVFSGSLSGASGSFSGAITASSGAIGNLVINSLGLQTSNGLNWLRGNGDLKWGGLTISGSTATFTGTIFADKISGQVVDSQIATGLNASKVTFGQLTAIDIYGSRIRWDGVVMDTFGANSAFIQSQGTLELIVPGAFITLDDDFGGSVSIFGASGVFIGTSGQMISLDGFVFSNVSGDGGWTMSDTVRIQTNTGMKTFVFDNGLLINIF